MENKEIKGDCPDMNIRVNILNTTENWTTQQKNTIHGLMMACDKYKIDNKFVRIAILSVAGKETEFKPRAEIGYGGTPNQNIRALWPMLFGNMSDEDLNILKKDDVAFFNKVYGGKYGNTKYADGYNFRGRGPNQLTFRSNYDNLSRLTGINFTNEPDLLNEPTQGGIANVAYLIDRMDTIPLNLVIRNLNDIKDLESAILIVFRANAGWGKNIDNPHHQRTLQKCRDISKLFHY